MDSSMEIPCTQVLEDFLPDESLESSPEKKKQVGSLRINGTSYPIFTGENRIGRDSKTCSIVLDGKALSAQHAAIEANTADNVFVYDLESTNKTRLGKMVLKPHVRYQLHDNAQLYFADVLATYQQLVKLNSSSESGDASKEGDFFLPETPSTDVFKKPGDRVCVMESPSDDSIIECSQPVKENKPVSQGYGDLSNGVRKQIIFGEVPDESTLESICEAATQLDYGEDEVKEDSVTNSIPGILKESDLNICDEPTQCVDREVNEKSTSNGVRSLSDATLSKEGDIDVFEAPTQYFGSSAAAVEEKSEFLVPSAKPKPENLKEGKLDICDAPTQCIDEFMDDNPKQSGTDSNKETPFDIHDAPTQCFDAAGDGDLYEEEKPGTNDIAKQQKSEAVKESNLYADITKKDEKMDNSEISSATSTDSEEKNVKTETPRIENGGDSDTDPDEMFGGGQDDSVIDIFNTPTQLVDDEKISVDKPHSTERELEKGNISSESTVSVETEKIVSDERNSFTKPTVTEKPDGPEPAKADSLVDDNFDVPTQEVDHSKPSDSSNMGVTNCSKPDLDVRLAEKQDNDLLEAVKHDNMEPEITKPESKVSEQKKTDSDADDIFDAPTQKIDLDGQERKISDSPKTDLAVRSDEKMNQGGSNQTTEKYKEFEFIRPTSKNHEHQNDSDTEDDLYYAPTQKICQDKRRGIGSPRHDLDVRLAEKENLDGSKSHAAKSEELTYLKPASKIHESSKNDSDTDDDLFYAPTQKICHDKRSDTPEKTNLDVRLPDKVNRDKPPTAQTSEVPKPAIKSHDTSKNDSDADDYLFDAPTQRINCNKPSSSPENRGTGNLKSGLDVRLDEVKDDVVPLQETKELTISKTDLKVPEQQNISSVESNTNDDLCELPTQKIEDAKQLDNPKIKPNLEGAENKNEDLSEDAIQGTGALEPPKPLSETPEVQKEPSDDLDAGGDIFVAPTQKINSPKQKDVSETEPVVKGNEDLSEEPDQEKQGFEFTEPQNKVPELSNADTENNDIFDTPTQIIDHTKPSDASNNTSEIQFDNTVNERSSEPQNPEIMEVEFAKPKSPNPETAKKTSRDSDTDDDLFDAPTQKIDLSEPPNISEPEKVYHDIGPVEKVNEDISKPPVIASNNECNATVSKKAEEKETNVDELPVQTINQSEKGTFKEPPPSNKNGSKDNNALNEFKKVTDSKTERQEEVVGNSKDECDLFDAPTQILNPKPDTSDDISEVKTLVLTSEEDFKSQEMPKDDEGEDPDATQMFEDDIDTPIESEKVKGDSATTGKFGMSKTGPADSVVETAEEMKQTSSGDTDSEKSNVILKAVDEKDSEVATPSIASEITKNEESDEVLPMESGEVVQPLTKTGTNEKEELETTDPNVKDILEKSADEDIDLAPTQIIDRDELPHVSKNEDDKKVEVSTKLHCTKVAKEVVSNEPLISDSKKSEDDMVKIQDEIISQSICIDFPLEEKVMPPVKKSQTRVYTNRTKQKTEDDETTLDENESGEDNANEELEEVSMSPVLKKHNHVRKKSGGSKRKLSTEEETDTQDGIASPVVQKLKRKGPATYSNKSKRLKVEAESSTTVEKSESRIPVPTVGRRHTTPESRRKQPDLPKKASPVKQKAKEEQPPRTSRQKGNEKRKSVGRSEDVKNEPKPVASKKETASKHEESTATKSRRSSRQTDPKTDKSKDAKSKSDPGKGKKKQKDIDKSSNKSTSSRLKKDQPQSPTDNKRSSRRTVSTEETAGITEVSRQLPRASQKKTVASPAKQEEVKKPSRAKRGELRESDSDSLTSRSDKTASPSLARRTSNRRAKHVEEVNTDFVYMSTSRNNSPNLTKKRKRDDTESESSQSETPKVQRTLKSQRKSSPQKKSVSPQKEEPATPRTVSSRGNKRKLEESNDQEVPPSPKRARGSRLNETVASAVVSSPTRGRSRGNKTYKVLFTGVTCSKEDQNFVEKLGGSVVDTPDTCTVLVTDKVRRTFKFLCIMGMGKPIVSLEWLKKSRQSGSFLDPWQYIVKDVESEKKFKFSLQKSLKIASQTPLLAGYSVLVTGSVKPPPNEMKGIITGSGGKILARNPGNSWPDKSFTISCPEDRSQWTKFKKGGRPIVGAEVLLLGVLQQNLDLKVHALH